jgi:hypothetical protein
VLEICRLIDMRTLVGNRNRHLRGLTGGFLSFNRLLFEHRLLKQLLDVVRSRWEMLQILS